MKKLFRDKNSSCFLSGKQFEVTDRENGRRVKILSTPCNHLFHRVCLRNWFRNEANGNFCPHCHRSMEWRDATPLGKEATATSHSSLAASKLKPEVTVQSLEAEIRHRKAQELLQKKEAAERAKLELSKQQRAQEQERRQRQRRESHNAVHAKQNRKICGKFVIILVWIVSVVCVKVMLFTNKTVEVENKRNFTVMPLLSDVALRQRHEEGRKKYRMRLEAINKKMKSLDEAISVSESQELLVKKYKLEKMRDDAKNMVKWFSVELADGDLKAFRVELSELVELAYNAMDSVADWDNFLLRGKRIMGLPNEYVPCNKVIYLSKEITTYQDLLAQDKQCNHKAKLSKSVKSMPLFKSANHKTFYL